jgi:hypothetical protein
MNSWLNVRCFSLSLLFSSIKTDFLIPCFAQLNAIATVLDRSDAAMKSISGPAGVDVVETIEDENVAQTSAIADLLEAAQAEVGTALPSAATTDDEDE